MLWYLNMKQVWERKSNHEKNIQENIVDETCYLQGERTLCHTKKSQLRTINNKISSINLKWFGILNTQSQNINHVDQLRAK